MKFVEGSVSCDDCFVPFPLMESLNFLVQRLGTGIFLGAGSVNAWMAKSPAEESVGHFARCGRLLSIVFQIRGS